MSGPPLLVIFIVTNILVILFIELGYRMGRTFHNREKNEKEPPVAAISGSIFGLLAFMLAFTFGIVSNKFEARKALVREEANAIGTLYLRTDFMPEPGRTQTRELLRKYVDLRLDIVKKPGEQYLLNAINESTKIQQQLWDIAIAYSQTAMNSHTGSLYFQSLNNVIDIQGMRVAVAYQTQIPSGIWIALYSLLMLGMISIGYSTAVADSTRSMATVILALSFSVVITLIAAMDSLQSNYINITQQPMEEVRKSMSGH